MQGLFRIWSGRWESNPAPNTAKLLIYLVDSRGLASISVHNRGNLLDCFPVRVPHNMAVNLKRRPRISVAELALSYLRRGSRVEQEGRVRMAERVESATRNPQRVKDRPETIFDYFV